MGRMSDLMIEEATDRAVSAELDNEFHKSCMRDAAIRLAEIAAALRNPAHYCITKDVLDGLDEITLELRMLGGEPDHIITAEAVADCIEEF